MDFSNIVILSVIQGLTEFLPISSSGHLNVMETLLGYSTNNLGLEIWLHSATLMAVFVVLYSPIKKLFLACTKHLLSDNYYSDKIFVLKLILATTITVPTALLITKIATTSVLGGNGIAVLFIISGIAILIAEYLRPQNIREFSWGHAVFLGLFQGVTVLPGLSRSGVTITFLIAAGIERKKALEISFLLAIPTILGAVSWSIYSETIWIAAPPLLLSAGFFIAFGVAIMTIKWMQVLVQKYWVYFAPYCIGLGVLLLLL